MFHPFSLPLSVSIHPSPSSPPPLPPPLTLTLACLSGLLPCIPPFPVWPLSQEVAQLVDKHHGGGGEGGWCWCWWGNSGGGGGGGWGHQLGPDCVPTNAILVKDVEKLDLQGAEQNRQIKNKMMKNLMHRVPDVFL